VAQFDRVGFTSPSINQIFKKKVMNDLFKKAIQAGLGLAVVTTERVKEIVEDFVDKGKTYQENQEKETKEEEETVKGEYSQDKEENEAKQSRIEEIEARVRKLIESAVARFNFIKSDEHERIEKRIEALEEKLNQLVKETIGQKTERSERI
jgi:polyhydroxyalkanoate synthesis regulator phasin